jgi:hypothetical protein
MMYQNRLKWMMSKFDILEDQQVNKIGYEVVIFV